MEREGRKERDEVARERGKISGPENLLFPCLFSRMMQLTPFLRALFVAFGTFLRDGRIDHSDCLTHSLTDRSLQGNLKQDLAHDPPCHPRAVSGLLSALLYRSVAD